LELSFDIGRVFSHTTLGIMTEKITLLPVTITELGVELFGPKMYFIALHFKANSQKIMEQSLKSTL
jgi:hypothetical protein